MGFVTPALLGGAALIGLPILLHLIMRREVKLLKFPALRFVQQRRSLNQHRLQLRHWLLLALRCAIIALLAMALARPILRGAGMAGKADMPVATVLVFDNSPRMEYQHENNSRLEWAKKLGAWILSQLPAEGRVSVMDRTGRQRGQDLDRNAAELRVERLETSASVRPLEDALRDAANWVGEQRDYRGEIYVFTDLSAEAWPEATLAEFRKRLDELPGTNVYLIDVGVKEPTNSGLGALRLSSQQLAAGGLLQLETDLTATGKAAARGEAVVQLYLDSPSGQPEKRGQQVVKPNDTGTAPVEFSLSGLNLGTHQGVLRVAGSDALPCDDARYFTVDVRPASKLLLLGQTEDDTLFLREALAPKSAAGLVQSKFECQTAQFDQLDDLKLSEFAAVMLVDPPPLTGSRWQALVSYVETGGGVGIFLGRQARRDEMNQAEAQKLLPAALRRQSRDATYLRPVAVEHPVLAGLRDVADSVPWSEFPVFTYWELEAGAKDAYVVAAYANDKPALIERPIGAGRVLMMTTSVSDPAHNDPWNLLPTNPDPWPFLALVNGIADYLAGAGDAQLNYVAGQTALLRLRPEEQVASYVLDIPGSSPVRQTLTPGQQDLTIASIEALGNYRVRAGGEQGKLDRGFSVNLPAEMGLLDRVPPEKIAEALGEERVRVARTPEEIEVRVGLGRVGREVFPALILAMALALGAEQWLANRFYRTEP